MDERTYFSMPVFPSTARISEIFPPRPSLPSFTACAITALATSTEMSLIWFTLG